ncbi:MAG: cation-transporting P-type ATPase [Candidatus Sumerlaeaceae bacterium]|nr:cation-transporting P-type ATPase [Candidatus Sumerlaeaceae bacterium]
MEQKANGWHARDCASVLGEFSTREEGLTSSEARQRLEQYGPNEISRARGEGPLVIIWRQINNPLIWVLLASSALAIVMGKGVDGFVVLGVVVVNTIIGFIQEYRAGKAIEALALMVPETTTVVRDGTRHSISAQELVPGDIVALASGDKVPADMRLLAVRNLQVEEAALTGESVPVEKSDGILEPDTVLADRRNMVYGGTLVTYGTATAVVVATGNNTELGRISSMLRETTDLETPLTKSMAVFGRYLTAAILAVAVALKVIGMIRGYGWLDAALAAISLAVAAIPEGLPAIITIALAIGVRRMANRRAIIRKLPAVETLGSTTVICSDKTGTLTRNEMTVQRLVTPKGEYSLTGVGYTPQGELQDAQGNALGAVPDDVALLLRAGLLCNDAALARGDDGAWRITGDPTEGALVVSAAKCGLGAEAVRGAFPRLDAIPFESERQYMATLHTSPDGSVVAYLKGAPEAVLRRCADIAAPAVLTKVEALASRGMRVLAFASKVFPQGTARLEESDAQSGFTFLGLQGMIDPPRPEAIEAVRQCHRAGIVVKMITGDHKSTALAIGRELGLVHEGESVALTGAELAVMNDAQLREAADQHNVFARVAPEHKLRLVRALQANGEVVAMTGDGVNDAPALKQANIGVAMGITGTAVSKEAADIVLTDDNFASIRAAVEEGRRVYDNLIKALAFVLPTNIGQALIVLTAVAFFPIIDGQPIMAILPVQILWVNLVVAVALALPLAFEAMEPDVMARPPRRPNAPILSKFVVLRTVMVGILMTVGGVGMFLYEYYTELQRGIVVDLALREAQTIAVTTIMFFQTFYLLNCRSLRDSILKIGLFSNPTIYLGIGVLMLLQIAFVHLPLMNTLFDSAPLSLEAWIKSAAVGALVLPVISLEKWLRQRRQAAR